MNNHAIRTTLNLPAELLEASDRAVSESKAKSRNELATQKRAEIDAEFAHMAKDTAYQAEVKIISQEFAHSDWEALQLG
jgi:metal-responsive CopG/Arc/MetJ family transcriptional regulator